MIHSCYGCVPPKRTPTCKFDGTCNRYTEAKKKHDADKAKADEKRSIESGLINQAVKGIDRAYKAQRKLKGR